MDKDTQYKADILEAIGKIAVSVSAMEYNDFINDADAFDACVRRLEIIGEAVKALSADFKDRLPVVPWKEIAKFRDKAIHHYAEINAAIVWETIQSDLPALKKALEENK